MGRVHRLVHQLRWSIAVRGVSGTGKLVVRRLLGGSTTQAHTTHTFDVLHGVETSGRISGAELGAGHPHDVHSTAYLPVPPSRFEAAIAQWQSLAGTRSIGDYAFVDLGCGKGRAVLLAAGMGFRECLGVELDPGLAATAENNVDVWRRASGGACPIRIVNADAVEAELPRLPLLIYLYNPFRAVVVRRLLARLEAFSMASPGEMDVIYLIPEETAEFAARPHFARLWSGAIAASEEDAVQDRVDRYDACEIYRA